ncbi:MAG TPA: DNA gyrase inhibitor YacG [Verrucomicrobiae bacterium]|nr:DNA gyrase inhibitor YacG [Verrucomicrobiae bacterium]
MSKKSVKQIVCPVCKKAGDWFAGRYGPFCSHRCKMIDLGKWLAGEHAISEPLFGEDVPAGKNGMDNLPGRLN